MVQTDTAQSEVRETGVTNSNTASPIIDEATLLKRIPICRRTAKAWREKGILPFIKAGPKRVMYHWASVEQAMLRLQRGGA